MSRVAYLTQLCFRKENQGSISGLGCKFDLPISLEPPQPLVECYRNIFLSVLKRLTPANNQLRQSVPKVIPDVGFS